MDPRQCFVCGKTFQPTNGKHRYCSGKCSEIGVRQNNNLKHKSLKGIIYKCVHCGIAFSPSMSNQKYCSFDCRLKDGYINSCFTIFIRDRFTCIYCGKSSFGDGVKLHVDHIHPKSKGGSNRADNLATACFYCNVNKNNKILPNESEILAEVEKRNKIRDKVSIR
jgi:predicted nucleic acid-binding Zn ribbon protein